MLIIWGGTFSIRGKGLPVRDPLGGIALGLQLPSVMCLIGTGPLIIPQLFCWFKHLVGGLEHGFDLYIYIIYIYIYVILYIIYWECHHPN